MTIDKIYLESRKVIDFAKSTLSAADLERAESDGIIGLSFSGTYHAALMSDIYASEAINAGNLEKFKALTDLSAQANRTSAKLVRQYADCFQSKLKDAYTQAALRLEKTDAEFRHLLDQLKATSSAKEATPIELITSNLYQAADTFEQKALEIEKMAKKALGQTDEDDALNALKNLSSYWTKRAEEAIKEGRAEIQSLYDKNKDKIESLATDAQHVAIGTAMAVDEMIIKPLSEKVQELGKDFLGKVKENISTLKKP